MENQMGMPNVQGKKVIRISKKKFWWSVAIIVILLVILAGFLVLSSLNSARTRSNTSINVPNIESPGANYGGGYLKSESYDDGYYPYPDYNQNGDITDTREFNKVSYSASIKTREVEDVTDDVKDAIEEADGRIDDIQESTKYGYVRFVVPKSEFSDFKDKIEELTHEKLFTDTTSSTNLLGQKQNIEEQNSNLQSSLSSLLAEQQNLKTKHNQNLSFYQSELLKAQTEIKVLNTQIAQTTDQQLLISLNQQLTIAKSKEVTQQQNISSENKSYISSNQNLQLQIDNTRAQIDGVKRQDQNFTNNIETVSGTINISWVSLWGMSVLISPIHPAFILLALAILVIYFLKRKNVIPSVELV